MEYKEHMLGICVKNKQELKKENIILNEKLIENYICLAEIYEQESRELSIQFYELVIDILESQMRECSREYFKYVYTVCYEGIVKVSDDDEIINKITEDLKNLKEKEK